jgi:outer membrane protein TolC
MRKILLISSVLCTLVSAQDIDTLIQSAYENNYNLKALKSEVEINVNSQSIADNWDNPTLSAGFSDLQLNDISDRTKEPMQTQFITLSQKIPLKNKNGILKDISKEKTKLSRLKIEDKKAEIASKITTLSYKSTIIDRSLELIQKRVKNLKKIRKLTLAYQENFDNTLKIDLKLLKLENLRESLTYKKQKIIQEIQKFTVTKVTNIHTNLTQKELPKIDLNKHPKIAMLNQQLKIAKAKVKLSIAKKTPDIKLTGGYFQRDNRDDYINLSFALPLPIGDSEEVEIKKAKLEVIKIKQKISHLKNIFQNEIDLLKKRAKKATKNFDRYNQELLPKQKKIINLLKRKNSTSKTKLTEVIKSQNSSLDIQELALKELDEYFESVGKLRYYQ